MKIGEYSLDEIRNNYRADLFDTWLPFMDRHVIDHTHGGFMCNTRPDGTNISDEKRAGYEGRGIWVYSYLYNNLAKEDKYLDVAKKSLGLLLKNAPKGIAMHPARFKRDGTPSAAPSKTVNSDLYIADGIQEYAKATGDMKYWDMAKRLLIKCLMVYDKDSYNPTGGRGYIGKDAALVPGIRIMDDWMLFLWIATQMLRQKSDMDLLMIVTQCLDTIMNKFYNPATGLIHEILDHDYTRPINDYAHVINFGNSLQAIWHVMAAAERINNQDQFKTAKNHLRRHIEVARDDIYGGMLNTCVNIEENRWRLSKSHYVQVEPLIGLLMVIDRLGEQWAKDLFGQLYAYERETFHLHARGYPIWMNGADRRGTFDFDSCKRVGNFHQPRHLMLNLVRLEKMLG